MFVQSLLRLYTIQKQRKKMEKIILRHMRYESLINSVIHCLLPLSTTNDSEILKLCANCLGELGAIDFAAFHNHTTDNALLLDQDDDDDSDDEEKEVIVVRDDDDDDNGEEDSDLEVVEVKKKKTKSTTTQSKDGSICVETMSKEEVPKHIDNINDLCLHIIKNYLIPIHRTSNNSTTQNQAQYALQELLNVLECDENTPNESAKRSKSSNSLSVSNWRQFSDEMQELLIPCLRSTFLIKSEAKSNDNGSTVSSSENISNPSLRNDNETQSVFSMLMYQHGRIALDQWLYKFCKSLLVKIEQIYAFHQNKYGKSRKTRSSPRKSQQKEIEKQAKKLKAFKAVLCVKNNTALTTYLLPFLVDELLQSEEFIVNVVEEIRDVIQYEHIAFSQQAQLCVHRIFYLVDVLMSWFCKIPTDLDAFSKKFGVLFVFFIFSSRLCLCYNPGMRIMQR